MDFEQKQELLEFLRNNLSVSIERDQEYYSYPHLSVKLWLDGDVVSESSCTIYDGERN